MIYISQLSKIGRTLKPHGINGEISLIFDYDYEPNLFSCLIFNLEGIYVPFFIEQHREKTTSLFLVKFKGLNTDMEVAELSNLDIYVLKNELIDDECDSDGEMYAEDFIGYNIFEQSNVLIGEIVDFDDSTENALFIVKKADGNIIYIPIVDDFITDLDTVDKRVTMSLPMGLLDL